jgi:ABC-type branched-subunit amino acid transport system substrate-binding protein
VNGHPIELFWEDSQSDPKQSVAVAQKLVSDDRAIAELGDLSSTASMAASPIYQRNKLWPCTVSKLDLTCEVPELGLGRQRAEIRCTLEHGG